MDITKESQIVIKLTEEEAVRLRSVLATASSGYVVDIPESIDFVGAMLQQLINLRIRQEAHMDKDTFRKKCWKLIKDTAGCARIQDGLLAIYDELTSKDSPVLDEDFAKYVINLQNEVIWKDTDLSDEDYYYLYQLETCYPKLREERLDGEYEEWVSKQVVEDDQYRDLCHRLKSTREYCEQIGATGDHLWSQRYADLNKQATDYFDQLKNCLLADETMRKHWEDNYEDWLLDIITETTDNGNTITEGVYHEI